MFYIFQVHVPPLARLLFLVIGSFHMEDEGEEEGAAWMDPGGDGTVRESRGM